MTARQDALDHAAEQTVKDLFKTLDNGKRRPWEHIVRDRMAELLSTERYVRKTIRAYVVNRLREVTNKRGGVIGYTIELNPEETETLLRELERD